MTAKYRPDVDGLRGLAVIAVVLYHAFPEDIPGGFVGVDAFFVISGFLITGIIADGLQAGTFTFRDFYARRVRRIFPALLMVLIACWVAGMWLLDPEDLRSLGRHMRSGAGLFSNVIFWKQAGYFDVTSEAKPLLHLWSLGVEEQFYLVWPLLLFVSWRRFKGWLGVIAVVLVCSLVLDLIQTPTRHAAAAFYLPATRAWEFMLGAALAHPKVARRPLPARLADVAGWLGLALVVAAIMLLDRGMPYPGWRAVAPTVGTALVIAAGPKSSCNRRVLAGRVIVGVGLISYPLYLWHWPLLSFGRIENDFEISVAARLGVIAVSIVLAWLTYRYVERFLRRSSNPSAQRRKTIALLVTGGLVVILGVFTFRSDRLRSEVDAKTTAFKDIQARLVLQRKTQPCDADARFVGRAKAFCHQYGDVHGRPLLVIWGDSHATAWTPVLLDIASEQQLGVYIFSHAGCPPVLHVRRSDGIGNAGFCTEIGYAEDIAGTIKALHPQVVVLVARWSLYANGLRRGGHLAAASHFVTASEDGTATQATSRAALTEQLPRTVDELASTARRIVIFKSPPMLRTMHGGVVLRREPGLEPTLEAHRAVEAVTDGIIDALATKPRVTVFDPAAFLCTAKCSIFLDGVPFYIDDNHPSAQGSFKLRDAIASHLRVHD